MREAPEAPLLTKERLRSLEGRDPMAAALLSVVSSLPASEDAPDPDSLAAKEAQAAMENVATAKVKAWRKAGKKEKEKEPMKGYPMFGITWGEGFEAPYGEISATTCNDSSECQEDWISREPTPSLPSRPRPPSPRGVCPEPVRVERGLPSRMAAPKLGLDETMELLSRVLGAGDEDPDLSALSAALKAKLGLSELEKPPSTMSPGVELLTRGVKSCRGIRSTPLDTCPSPFHPRVRTVPVCTIRDTTEAEMEGYGLAALAPLPLSTPHPPQVEKVTLVYQIGERWTSPQRTFRSSSLSSILKTCPNGPKSFRSFYSSADSNMLMSGPSARSSRSRARKSSFSGR